MREQLCSRVGNSRTVTHFTHIPCGAGVIVSRLVLLMLLSLKGMHRYRKQHRYQVRYIEIPVSVVQKKKADPATPFTSTVDEAFTPQRMLRVNFCCTVQVALCLQKSWRQCFQLKRAFGVKSSAHFLFNGLCLLFRMFRFFIYGFLVYLFNLCFIIYILCRRIVSVCHRITHFP